jgi:hypothetical protein
MMQENRVVTSFPPIYGQVVILPKMAEFIYENPDMICG